jgi:hypothetical protein
LFDALKEKDKVALNFGAITTTSFKDPIFNDTWHWEWIDHVLYSHVQGGPWVSSAQVHTLMAGNRRIWEKYEYASDHFPVSVVLTV